MATETESAEQRARTAFEAVGGPMTDREWREAQGRLRDFFRIAAEWAENPPMTETLSVELEQKRAK